MFIFYAYFISIDVLPNQLTLLEGEKYLVRTCFGTKILATSETVTSSEQKLNVEISLFGKIKLKTIAVTILEDIEVIPIGKIIGLKLYTNGVLIVGMSEIESIENKLENSFENTDIK